MVSITHQSPWIVKEPMKLPKPLPSQPALTLMTPAECADMLRLTARTIRRWLAEGRLTAKRTHPGRGGRILLDRAEVLRAVGITEAVSA